MNIKKQLWKNLGEQMKEDFPGPADIAFLKRVEEIVGPPINYSSMSKQKAEPWKPDKYHDCGHRRRCTGSKKKPSKIEVAKPKKTK